MSFLDQSSPIQAKLTIKARDVYARSGLHPVAFKIVGFSVGCSGYDPLNPLQTLPVDDTQQTLGAQVFPDTVGYAAFQSIEEIESVMVFNCRLPATQSQSNADYGLGELGLWAEVIHSEDPTLNVGDVYLYAIAHMPLRAKTHKDVFLFRVVVNY